MNSINHFLFAIAIAVGFASCTVNGEDVIEEGHKPSPYAQAFTEKVGPIGTNQTWNSANTAYISFSGKGTNTVSIVSIAEAERTIIHQETVKGSSTITFDLPQGICNEIGVVVTPENGEKEYRRIAIEEFAKGAVAVDVTKASHAATTRATAAIPESKASLVGKSEQKLWGYCTFPGWIWESLASALPEAKNAKNQINNFSLESNGTFYVSMIYGCTGNNIRTIGYYYHPKGHPEQIKYVTLVNALSYDYYYDDINVSQEEALCKVQYKLKDGDWQNTNFNHYDRLGWENKGRISAHWDDEEYTVLDVYNRQKSQIEAVRGLTFQIPVEKGNVVGFWITKDNNAPNLTGKNMNHSSIELNKKVGCKLFTSTIKVYDGFRFIGLEDSNFDTKAESTAEPDCNDIVLAMVAGDDGELPGVLLPYVKNETPDANGNYNYYNADGTLTLEPKPDSSTGEKPYSFEEDTESLINKAQTWTIAFEDLGTIGDFDFNDVVIRVTPQRAKNKATLTLCAAGGKNKSYLYYNNGKKDICFGEVHELLGVEGATNIGSSISTNFWSTEIDWPKERNIADYASSFFIVSNDQKITVPTRPGETPTAICVGTEWEWPSEGVNIAVAYENFASWSADYSTYTDWYKNGKSNKVTKKSK